jgi:hypothetical protein
LRGVAAADTADPDRRLFAVGLRHWAIGDGSKFLPDVLELWSRNPSGAWLPVVMPATGDGYARYGGADVAWDADRLVLVGWIEQFDEGTPAAIDRGPGSFVYSSP